LRNITLTVNIRMEGQLADGTDLTFNYTFRAGYTNVPLSPPKVAPQIQLKDLGDNVRFPQRENDICSHQTCSLGSKYPKNVFAEGCIWNPGERECWLHMSSYFC